MSLLSTTLLLIAPLAAGTEEPVSFRSQIAPILNERCLACHGPKKAEGGYRVDTYQRAMQAGDSETPGFAPGDHDESEAYRRILSDDESERMPLESDPLSEAQQQLLRRWIAEGAKFDGSDPTLPLAAIVPPPVHPDPPRPYPHPLPVTAVAIISEGKQVLVGGYHELTIWNVSDGTLARRITNVGQRTYGLALHPDGKQVAVACGAPGKLGEVRLFDLDSGRLNGVLGSTGDVALDVAFRPDGGQLAIGSADGLIRIFEVASGKLIHTIASHSDWINAVCWSTDGKLLASASRDKTAKVFDAATGELKITYSGHGQPVKGVAFHPNNAEVYSGGADRKIHRWKIADAKKSAEIGFGNEVYKLPIHGDVLLAASADKTVRQVNAQNHKVVRSLTGHQDWALAVAFDPTSKRIASGGFDGEVRVWNAEDGKLLTTLTALPRK